MRGYVLNNIKNDKDKEEAVCRRISCYSKWKDYGVEQIGYYAAICVRKMWGENIFIFAFIALEPLEERIVYQIMLKQLDIFM